MCFVELISDDGDYGGITTIFTISCFIVRDICVWLSLDFSIMYFVKNKLFFCRH